MKIKTFPFSPIGENTYVVYDDTKECVIIDAGCYSMDEKTCLLNFILENKLVVKHAINTHLHFDHVLGANFVKDQFGLDIEANEKDQFLLDGLPAQMRMFGFDPMDRIPTIGKYLDESDTIQFGKQQFTILHVPGHSPGSIVFYSKENNCLFAGDVLFRRSVGRTDLAEGNHKQLIKGIRKKLLVLPPETVVYPGHGPSTTIDEEKKENPYLARRKPFYFFTL